MSTFRIHDDVAVVEHDDATRQPREGGKVMRASVIELGGIYVQIRYENGSKDAFYQESGWRAWDGMFQWRLVSVCRCEKPILGEPVTDPDDPTERRFCSEDCLDSAGEAWYEQHYRPGVAT